MPKAVLDSSVLISAFIKPHGRVMELLRQPLRGRYQMYLSEEILSETAEVLLSKESIRHNFVYQDEDVRAYIGWLLSVAELVDDIPESPSGMLLNYGSGLAVDAGHGGDARCGPRNNGRLTSAGGCATRAT